MEDSNELRYGSFKKYYVNSEYSVPRITVRHYYFIKGRTPDRLGEYLGLNEGYYVSFIYDSETDLSHLIYLETYENYRSIISIQRKLDELGYIFDNSLRLRLREDLRQDIPYGCDSGFYSYESGFEVEGNETNIGELPNYTTQRNWQQSEYVEHQLRNVLTSALPY